MYKIFSEPSLLVNTEGLTLRTAHFSWLKIKRITSIYDFKTGTVHFQILLKENITVQEKVDHFPFSDYNRLILTIRTFKKKNRNPFIFINKNLGIKTGQTDHKK
nr:hypothetical protein [uncultured Chryseobacterium sp.]